MNSKKPELTLLAGDQATLRRKVVQDLLHFRSREARETLDGLARRGQLRQVTDPSACADTPGLPRER